MMTRPTARIVKRLSGNAAMPAAVGRRSVAEEVPVALSYGGTTHAVMMATPSDLEDFAFGFTLTDGIVDHAGAIEAVEIVDHETGIDLQISLTGDASAALARRRRHMAGPVGCGLCGIESIEQAVRPVRAIERRELALSAVQIAESISKLKACQSLNAQTRAVHAAGFYRPGMGILLAREDVGRHNALDKLVGAMARSGLDGATGAIVITSRVSVEMVQKVAACGCPFLLAISAPTALAIEMADAAGLTLIAVIRGQEYEIFTHPDRLEKTREKPEPAFV